MTAPSHDLGSQGHKGYKQADSNGCLRTRMLKRKTAGCFLLEKLSRLKALLLGIRLGDIMYHILSPKWQKVTAVLSRSHMAALRSPGTFERGHKLVFCNFMFIFLC